MKQALVRAALAVTCLLTSCAEPPSTGDAKENAASPKPSIDSAAPESQESDPDDDIMSPEEEERIMRVIQGDLDAAKNDVERFYALGAAAKVALKAGQTEDARNLAIELERLVPQYREDWNYGNTIQDANQVLGRIALAAGDVEEAKKRLLASADSDGSPQMNSFGPNFQLAKELLARGESDVVLQYLERCGTFWKDREEQLAAWIEAIRQGETPDFGRHARD